MVKVRIQGTPEEMKWFVDHLNKNEKMEIDCVSRYLKNVGTKRYLRQFFHVIRKEK